MIANVRGAAQPVALPRRSTAIPAQPSDPRADGQARSVSLTRDVVRIDRRVQGVAMRLAVPVHAYRGVALLLRPDEGGALSYGLRLLHPDAELSVTLDQASDDQDIVADWRLWSRFFRLPALVERQAGTIVEADARLGKVVLGEGAADRRAGRLTSRRRPRFLRRRKPGIGPAHLVHAGEREMIARS